MTDKPKSIQDMIDERIEDNPLGYRDERNLLEGVQEEIGEWIIKLQEMLETTRNEMTMDKEVLEVLELHIACKIKTLEELHGNYNTKTQNKND